MTKLTKIWIMLMLIVILDTVRSDGGNWFTVVTFAFAAIFYVVDVLVKDER